MAIKHNLAEFSYFKNTLNMRVNNRQSIGCCVLTMSLKGMTMKTNDSVLNPREIRLRRGLNQERFWSLVGVTQSGGSRYESGRAMPKPVRELLRLVHVEQIDLAQIRRVDYEIIKHLKANQPDLYRSLSRAVKSKWKDYEMDETPEMIDND
jgi:transcriptional regulator with XRE-family HTH domain